MSNNVDERIVGMQFDNKQFEASAKTTMSTMDKLKATLSFDGAKKGIDDLSDAAKNLNLQDKLGNGLDGLMGKFSALQVVALGALANIGAKAVDMGLQMAKSLTIDPIKAGFDEYELKLGSIQTILANTSKFGTKLPEVTAALDELNTYADKTIYNFGDMTKNIGLFTNAGINIKDATAMIKGFSNEAASSGASAEGAAGAAYQLSQALSRGKITLQDWNSLANAGMGSANMKDGIIQIAQAMGTFNSNTTDANTAQKDFNGSLEKGWLSSDVMSTYLKIQAGELDATAMATLGLSDTQIAAFQAQQKVAEDAATKVRSFTGLVGTLREAVGSGWSETFEIIVGDFDEATNLWTSVNDKLGGVIGAMGQARNDMLRGWDALGGRQDLIDIGANLYNSIANIIRPIQQAWAKIFPPDGGSALKSFTGGLSTITGVIENITSGLVKLQPVFEVVFGLFKIGFSIVTGVLGVFVNIFALLGGAGTGSVLGVVGGFAALVAKVTEFINQGQYVTKFFDGIKAAQTAVLAPLLDFFNRIKDAVMAFVKTGDKATFIESLKNSFQAFAPLIDLVSAKLQVVSGWLKDLGAYFEALGDKGQGWLSTLGAGLATAGGYLANFAKGFAGLKSMIVDGDFTGSDSTWGWMEDSKPVAMLFDIRDALMGVKTQAQGLDEAFDGVAGKFSAVGGAGGEQVVSIWTRIGDAFQAVAKFLQPAISAIGSFFSWLSSTVKRILDDLSGQDMLALVNTGLFMAAYLAVKKFFDQFADLFKSGSEAFEAAGSIFTQLTDNLKTMQQEVQSKIILNIAIAVALLAASIALLAQIEPAKLATGIGAITLLITELVMAMKKLSMDGGIKDAAAMGIIMVTLAGSLLVLSAAVAIFGNMDPETLAVGLGSIALAIGTLVAATTLMSKFAGNITVSAGLILALSTSMLILAGVVAVFGNMDIGTLVQGVGAMVIVLGILVGAALLLAAVAPEVTIGAGLILALGAALLLASVGMLIGAKAVGVLADSLEKFTKIDNIWAGIGAMAAALGVLAIAMTAMTAGIVGAVALVIITAALLAFIPVLLALSLLPWDTVIRGLEVMAVVLTGIALMSVLAPGLIVLGAALLVLGAGLVLSGVGLLAFATAFGIFATIGTAGIVALTATVVGLAELLPLIMEQFGLGIKALAAVIGEAGPELTQALSTLLIALGQAIIDATPKVVEAMVTLLMGLLQAVQIVGPEYIKTIIILLEALITAVIAFVPRMVTAAVTILTGFLTGLRNNLSKLITAGTDLIISFIQGITNSALKITNAALDAIVTFVNGLATAIRTHTAELNEAGRNLAGAIVDGLTGGLGSMVGKVTQKARDLVANIPTAIKKFLGIASPSKVTTKLGEFTGEGVAVGLENMGTVVYKAAQGTGEQAVKGLTKGVSNAMSDVDMNLNPVIKPVLDLTDVKAGASQIDNILAPSTVSVGTSTSSAQSISASSQEAEDSTDVPNPDAGVNNITFVQNNSSPKEISSADTYRNTKNQLSQIKEGLPG